MKESVGLGGSGCRTTSGFGIQREGNTERGRAANSKLLLGVGTKKQSPSSAAVSQTPEGEMDQHLQNRLWA